jgi:hypothetical protein
MTAGKLALCAAALMLSSAPFAQQSNQGLTRLFGENEVTAEGVADPEAWRERLTQPDLALRETELDRFLAIARRDADARALLADWAADPAGGELAWTARLALRELDQELELGTWPFGLGNALGSKTWTGMPPGMPPGMPKDIQELLESLGSMNLPPDASGLGVLPGLGLQFRGGSQGRWNLPSGAAEEHSSRAVELSITPDGVRCKVTEEVDGEERTSEYEAKSMEELLAAHPELGETLQVEGGDHGLGLAPLGGWSWRQSWPLPTEGDSGELRTDILGVYVHPLTAEESARHGLEDGRGLRVDRTMPGTIAATLGIQRGHILLEINDRPVNRHEDISEVLCDRPADGDLRLRIIDSWGRERTCVWKPNGKPTGSPGESPVESADARPKGRQF